MLFIILCSFVHFLGASYVELEVNGSNSELPSWVFDPSTLCKGPIDAITTLSNKETYVFQGQYCWKLTDDGVGYPRYISKEFRGIPSDLDAVFTWENKTYFFKGNEFWRLTYFEYFFNFDEGYPKTISEGFPGIPDNVDTAFVWGGNGQIYFFKGANYWKFDHNRRRPVNSRYPREIANWKEIPNYIDAVFQYSNGLTYFFKNTSYGRLNDPSDFSTDPDDPPRDGWLMDWWFKCPKKEDEV